MAVNKSNRKPLTGNNRSHALNATKRKQKLNLQKVSVDGKSVRMSKKEIRSMTKAA